MRRFIFAALACCLTTPAIAQRIDLRIGTRSLDTVYAMPRDTVKLRARAFTMAGGTTTARNVTVLRAPDCHRWSVRADTVVGAFDIGEGCDDALGWLVVQGSVSGEVRRDSVHVARTFDIHAFSLLGLCLTSSPRALFYNSRDTVTSLAIQGSNNRIAMSWASDRFPVDFGWQSGTKVLKLYAIACLPGYDARDVTASAAWLSRDTTVATVSQTGWLTWKSSKPFDIVARWPK